MIKLARVSPRDRGAPGTVPDDGREFQEATTVTEFVPLLLARLPPIMKDLLTMFNTAGYSACSSGQAQDGLVLQAIQGTQAYREVSRLESYSSGGGDVCDDDNGGARVAEREGPGGAFRNDSYPEGAGCGCPSRHALSILTYALLTMLHKRDAAIPAGGAGVGVGGGSTVVGVVGAGRAERVWHRDPLAILPKPVADEAVHVAGMLEGLMEMEECKKCGI